MEARRGVNQQPAQQNRRLGPSLHCKSNMQMWGGQRACPRPVLLTISTHLLFSLYFSLVCSLFQHRLLVNALITDFTVLPPSQQQITTKAGAGSELVGPCLNPNSSTPSASGSVGVKLQPSSFSVCQPASFVAYTWARGPPAMLTPQNSSCWFTLFIL